MAHWAQIDENNVVRRVVVMDDDATSETCADLFGGTWLQCSYNTRGGVHYTDGVPSDDQTKALRANFPSVGFTYDEENDVFVPPQISQGWVLNAGYEWEPPTPEPTEEGPWVWNNATESWVRFGA